MTECFFCKFEYATVPDIQVEAASYQHNTDSITDARIIEQLTVMSEKDKQTTPCNDYNTPKTIRSVRCSTTESDATSPPATFTAKNVTPSISNVESKTTDTKGGEPSLHEQQPVLHEQKYVPSTDDSGYVIMNPKERPESDNPKEKPQSDSDTQDISISPDSGHEYEVIDEEKLDPSVPSVLVPDSPPPLPTARGPKPDKVLRPLRIVDYSEPKKEHVSMASECCRQILIQGIPVSMSTKDVGLNFETEMLTVDDGFEDIMVDRTHREAVITMKNTRAANDLLKRAESGEKFAIQGNEVSISPYHQAPPDPFKVYILGLTNDTTTDDISKYIEKICGTRPLDVIKGNKSEIALLRFDKPPDVTQMQLKIENLSPKENKFAITPVERTKRVRIRDVALETTPEALKHYFENEQLSKGRVTESIIPRDHFKDYIITFASIEDAERVVQQKIHNISNVSVDVTLYYPLLERDEEYILKVPGYEVFQNLNKDICRFLQISTQYRKRLEEMVKNHHGRVIWPDEKREERLCIQCIVDENDILGIAKVKDWKQNAAGVVSEICKKLYVQYTDFALEILGDLRSEIERMAVSDPESNFVRFEENRIVVAGRIKPVEELSAELKRLTILLEGDLDSRGQPLTKILKVKEHEMELFKEFNFQEQLTDVNTSLKDKNIVFTGKKKMVEEAILETKDMIARFPKQNIEGINMFESGLLRSKETTMYVKGKIKDSRVIGAWEFLENGALVMYSKTSEDLKTAVNVLKSSLKCTTIKVDSRIGKYLQQGDGKKCLAEIERMYEGILNLKPFKDSVCIVSVDSRHQEIREEVDELVDEHSDVVEVFHLDPGVFRYLFSYKTNVIDKIMKQFKCKSVEIEIIDKQTRKGFMISGEKKFCKLAVVELDVVVNTVTRTDYTINRPLFDKFLRSPKGINDLNKIELAEKCVIRISTADSKAVTEKTRNSVLAECRIGHCDIRIVQGDISEEAVDYIVNPTDSMLDHKRGLGCTLVDKGGFDIQKACNDYIQSHSLKDGDIFVGTAGSLQCRGIIHAVVPTWRDGTSNEESVLNRVVTQCLNEADKSRVARISFPPVGAGKFGYPNEIIAEFMIKAIKKYLEEHGTGTDLRHVSICDIDRAIPPLLVKEIEKGFGQTSVMTQELQTYSGQIYPKESDKREQLLTPITREIITGSITAQDTDVIANSTNSNLDLRIGTISRTLAKEGGEKISAELKEKYPKGIIAGEIAETSGGNLKCKALFHGVLAKWNKDQEYAEMVLKCFVRNCLLTSHKRRYMSITFPVLGSGALEFPPDRVAEIMFEAIDTFEEEIAVSSLKTIRIIIHPKDEKSFKAFDDYKSQLGKKGRLSRLSDISRRQSCNVENVFTEIAGTVYSTTIRHVTLCIGQGDLTKATTAVIVNSVLEDLNMKTGNISRAILRAAGLSIQHEANNYRKSFKQSGLVMTSSGRLLCQKIIHVKAKNSLPGWKKAVTKCLSEVENSSLNSVSFPALGTGGKGFPPSEIAKTMVEAFQDYILGENYKGRLRNVKIIVYDTKMVEEFTKEAKVTVENSPKKSFFQEFKFWGRKPTEETECSRMVFHIYTESPNGVTEVVRRIEDLHKEANK